MFCEQNLHVLGVGGGGGGERSCTKCSAEETGTRNSMEESKCSCHICVTDHSFVIFQLLHVVQSWAAVPTKVEWSGCLCRRVLWDMFPKPKVGGDLGRKSGHQRNKDPASLTTCCQDWVSASQSCPSVGSASLTWVFPSLILAFTSALTSVY